MKFQNTESYAGNRKALRTGSKTHVATWSKCPCQFELIFVSLYNYACCLKSSRSFNVTDYAISSLSEFKTGDTCIYSDCLYVCIITPCINSNLATLSEFGRCLFLRSFQELCNRQILSLYYHFWQFTHMPSMVITSSTTTPTQLIQRCTTF